MEKGCSSTLHNIFDNRRCQHEQADSTNNDALKLHDTFSKVFKHIKICVVHDAWEEVGEILPMAEYEAKRMLKWLI